MIPRVHKTVNLAPLIPDRLVLHDMACSFAEEQFKLKGECSPMWLIAIGSTVGFVETRFENGPEKRLATHLIRTMLKEVKAQAYSFITECWIAAFGGDMEEKERQHWLDFADRHGVCALPAHLRDDALMVSSLDRAGGHCLAKYLVTIRTGKGPNFLGPRMDENDQFSGMAGPMFNLFEPEKPVRETTAEAWAVASQAARATKR